MADYVIVTVKLPRNPEHNPREKVVGTCPLSHPDEPLHCTDVTGEHHSILTTTDGMTVNDVKAEWEEQGFHVTRVEEVSGG